jgi:26S proteasome regulatory subunit N7
MIEENIPVDHLITLGDLRFKLNNDATADKKQVKEEILNIVKENQMAPYYSYLVEHEGTTFKRDVNLEEELRKQNEVKLKELDDKIKDAEENFGENEVREALLAKAEYYHKIGDKDKALEAYRITTEKTVALGQRLDIVFAIMRIGFSWLDLDLLRRNIEKAKSMIEEGGDWERRNRLKVYEGVYLLIVRNFKGAADLFLESISTFSSMELMTYERFVFYTIVVSMISLERPEMKKKVVDSSDILSVIGKIPHAEAYLNSLYNIQYREFLIALAEISDEIKKDRFISPHVRYYSREMRIRAYGQFLESYKSVNLVSMAEQFGLSVVFLDTELSRFISAGRLNAKIDKVGGNIETNRPDAKNAMYQHTIKHGDQLLNRIQKLTRVIDL